MNEPSEIDKVYAAAMLDFEGSVSLRMSQSSVAAMISVYNTDESVVSWFHDLFGGTFCSRLGRKPNGEPGRQMFECHLHNRSDLQRAINLLRPFMRIKVAQMNVVERFLLLLVDPGERLDQANRWARFALVDELQALNGNTDRGPRSRPTRNLEST